VPEILKIFKVKYRKLLKDNKKIITKDKKISKYDYDRYDFNYYSQKGYNYFPIKPGNEIVNKRFVRETEDLEETESKYNFRICEIKNPIHIDRSTPPILPDLLELSGFSGYRLEYANKQVTNMKQLIKYYNKQGATRLIIFDFSCSTYFLIKKFTFLEGRNVNSIRRNMCKSKIAYGGKNSRRNRRNRFNKRTSKIIYNSHKLKKRTSKNKMKGKRRLG
jgi:hypothetical protein